METLIPQLDKGLRIVCEDILQTAKRSLEEKGMIESGAFLINANDEFFIIPFTPTSLDDKPKMMKAIKSLATQVHATVFGVLCEAWTVHRDKLEDFDRTKPMESQEGAQSSIVMQVETKNGVWMGISEIKESPDKKTFDIPTMKYSPEVAGEMIGIIDQERPEHLN